MYENSIILFYTIAWYLWYVISRIIRYKDVLRPPAEALPFCPRKFSASGGGSHRHRRKGYHDT